MIADITEIESVHYRNVKDRIDVHTRLEEKYKKEKGVFIILITGINISVNEVKIR